MTPLLAQLVAARAWLQILIDRLDLDPAATALDVAATEPGGRHGLATVTLAASLDAMDAAIAAATTEKERPDA